MNKDERRAALIRKFKEVGAERVQSIDRAWVKLEHTPDDPELAAHLLRELHTLKGESKAVGFADLNLVAHRLETLVVGARDAGFRVSSATRSIVFHAIDALGHLLQRSESGPQVDLDQVLASIEGAVTAKAAPPTSPVAVPEVSARRSPVRSPELSLRVPFARIESISTVAGELVVEHAQSTFAVAKLADTARKLELLSAAVGDGGALAALARSLKQQVAQLDENEYRNGLQVQELSRTARELRLVPVAAALESYLRMVRDLAAEQNKEAKLVVIGAEIEADKRVLDGLEEPLLHLLRNCVDHGIEAPDVREGLGKPRVGEIRIDLAMRGSVLALTLSDDGRGMDAQKLKARAVERGFVDASAAESLTHQQSLDLVFVPGFSTVDRATQLSGRGIGMDVVKRRVEQLGGRVNLHSELGRGIRVELAVPSTISLTHSLVFSLNERLFALPIVSVERIFRLTDHALSPSHDGLVVEIDGLRVPVAPLGPLLGFGGDARTDSVGILVRSGLTRCVLTLSSSAREVDLVVKPLGRPLNHHILISGAAVLDDGNLALVLEVSELLKLRFRASAVGSPSALPRPQARILLVEDSVIFRSTITPILEGLGFHVRTADDGLAGLAALETETPDAMMTDVQMPRMDGLEMVRRIRQDPRWKNLPVAVLSSLGAAEDRQRGLDAGANAYLLKGELTDEILSATLRRLLPDS